MRRRTSRAALIILLWIGAVGACIIPLGWITMWHYAEETDSELRDVNVYVGPGLP